MLIVNIHICFFKLKAIDPLNRLLMFNDFFTVTYKYKLFLAAIKIFVSCI
jgi:hypothetical protein